MSVLVPDCLRLPVGHPWGPKGKRKKSRSRKSRSKKPFGLILFKFTGIIPLQPWLGLPQRSVQAQSRTLTVGSCWNSSLYEQSTEKKLFPLTREHLAAFAGISKCPFSFLVFHCKMQSSGDAFCMQEQLPSSKVFVF